MQKVKDFYESIYREVWLGGFNNFQCSIFKFLKEHENRAQKLKIHEKLQNLSKKNLFSFPFLIFLYLKA